VAGIESGARDAVPTSRTYDVSAPLELMEDPVAQWLDWEQQANLVGFRTSTQPVEVEVVSVPRDEVEVHVLAGAPQAIIDRFVGADSLRFPRHPLNRDSGVAWFDAPVAERWTARFTASRTLAMPGPESGDALFSLKLSTDHPHPDFHQPEKTKLREEVVGALLWVSLVDRIDAMLPPLEVAKLVREVLLVLAKGGETGFMVRDLRSFQDGGYYLPALSVPWVGRQIAALHGTAFESFWGRCFAAPVGRAKAELFARYGLWFETPNPQNVVIQLDRSLRPTGRIIFRDLGDGECATNVFESGDLPWTRLTSDLRPETQNSFWAFSEAGQHSVAASTLEGWYRAHDDAYFGELARWFPSLAPPAAGETGERLAHWNEVLRSDAGAAAVVERFRSLA
jgi:hypothetical protein